MKIYEGTSPVAQGDMMMRKVDSLPDGLLPVDAEDGNYILTHSETGHHHVGEEYMGCKLNQKLDDYLKDNPDVVIVSEEELDDLLEAHYNGLKSEPEEITEERFMDMLEVLPPCKWQNMSGVEWFHVSEHLTGPLVSWFLRVGDKYYEFVDDCSLSSEQLMEKVNKLSEV